MSMRPCPQCGTALSAADAFCKTCGRDLRAGAGGFSSPNDPNNPLAGYAAKLNEGVVMQTAAASKIANNVGRTAIIVTILSLAGAGAMAYFVMQGVQDVTRDVTRDVNEIVDDSLKGVGAANPVTGTGSLVCAQELGAYLQVLIATKGSNDGGLTQRYGKSSSEYRNVQVAYKVYRRTLARQNEARARNAAQRVLRSRCNEVSAK